MDETIALIRSAPQSSEVLEFVCQQMHPLPNAPFDELHCWDMMYIALGKTSWIERRVRESGRHSITPPTARPSFDVAALVRYYDGERRPSMREVLTLGRGVWAPRFIEAIVEQAAWSGDAKSVCQYVHREISEGRFQMHFHEWVAGYSAEEKAVRALFPRLVDAQ